METNDLITRTIQQIEKRCGHPLHPHWAMVIRVLLETMQMMLVEVSDRIIDKMGDAYADDPLGKNNKAKNRSNSKPRRSLASRAKDYAQGHRASKDTAGQDPGRREGGGRS